MDAYHIVGTFAVVYGIILFCPLIGANFCYRDHQFVPQKITPDRLLSFRREHWGIETGLHYRRDVTLKEDTIWMTIGNTRIIMASINNLV